MVAGLQTVPMVAGFDGSGFAVEIDFTPLGAYQLLSLPLHHPAKTGIDPDPVMGAGWAANVTEQLASAPNWPHRRQILDALLTRRILAGTPPSPAAAEAWGLLREHIGLPAKTLSRIIRFHRARAVASTAVNSLAGLAGLAGYHDQAHMNQYFRALSGQTPRKLLDIMRRTPARNSTRHIQSFNDFSGSGPR